MDASSRNKQRMHSETYAFSISETRDLLVGHLKRTLNRHTISRILVHQGESSLGSVRDRSDRAAHVEDFIIMRAPSAGRGAKKDQITKTNLCGSDEKFLSYGPS